jgi:hypothetical protein
MRHRGWWRRCAKKVSCGKLSRSDPSEDEFRTLLKILFRLAREADHDFDVTKYPVLTLQPHLMKTRGQRQGPCCPGQIETCFSYSLTLFFCILLADTRGISGDLGVLRSQTRSEAIALWTFPHGPSLTIGDRIPGVTLEQLHDWLRADLGQKVLRSTNSRAVDAPDVANHSCVSTSQLFCTIQRSVSQ